MLEDLEVGSRMGIWAASIVLMLVLAGVAGGLWVRQWRAEHAARAASSAPPPSPGWTTARAPNTP